MSYYLGILVSLDVKEACAIFWVEKQAYHQRREVQVWSFSSWSLFLLSNRVLKRKASIIIPHFLVAINKCLCFSQLFKKLLVERHIVGSAG